MEDIGIDQKLITVTPKEGLSGELFKARYVFENIEYLTKCSDWRFIIKIE